MLTGVVLVDLEREGRETCADLVGDHAPSPGGLGIAATVKNPRTSDTRPELVKVPLASPALWPGPFWPSCPADEPADART